MNTGGTTSAQMRSLRGTLAGDGRPGPIEERIGRRLVRLVDPISREGKRLLGAGEVELVGPGGEVFGRVAPVVAYQKLRDRLERLILDPAGGLPDPETEDAYRETLDRLRVWSQRLAES